MQLPIDFINRMKNKLGEECDAFLASYDSTEIKALRLNRLRFEAANEDSTKESEISSNNEQLEEYKKLVFDELINNSVIDRDTADCYSSVPWESAGFYYDENVRPGKSPLHEMGAYYIQESSAMAPVSFLDVKPGDRVLDLCAAPGGKSTQIAGLLNGQGILITNEIVKKRAEILSENIERMGVVNALVVSEDPRNLAKRLPLYFDKILVDAPCSGEGMFRRGEIARNEWSYENVVECAKRQEWILDCAVEMLAPGGRLVYSTCTFSDEEDEEQVKALLDRHSDLCEISKDMKLCGGMERGTADFGIRLWPHKVKGEGHFLAAFEKSGERRLGSIPVGGFEKQINDKAKAKLKPMYDFLKEYVSSDITESLDRITMFGDNIYLLPDFTPSLNGLKVIRPGLQLGSIVKDRFMPSHSLALSLKTTEFKNIATIDNNVIYKYINGETFEFDGENGWYLITYKNMPAGFGKLAGGIMKNHYPKGLRKNLL